MTNNLLKVQRELTEEGDVERDEEGEEGQYVEEDVFGYGQNGVIGKSQMEKGGRSNSTDYDQPIQMVTEPQEYDPHPHPSSTQPH